MSAKKAKAESPKALDIDDIMSEVAMAMHTALRKACDSKPTALAWNTIYLMDHAWGGYARLVADALIGTKMPPIDAAKAALGWLGSLKLRERPGTEWLEKENAEHERRTLAGILGTFRDGDWEGMLSYLDDDFLKDVCGR